MIVETGIRVVPRKTFSHIVCINENFCMHKNLFWNDIGVLKKPVEWTMKITHYAFKFQVGRQNKPLYYF